MATDQYTRSKVGHHSEAKIKARGNESYGCHPSCLCSHQIMDSKATEVRHQLPHQWHQCLRDWEVLGVHTVADGPVGNPETYEDNLPVFKDEDTKDAITYQSCHWNLTVYYCTGCQDCTLLPLCHTFLTRVPRELVRSLGTDITLDDVLTILDEHYNNVKALDVLNQELFQLQMGEKETVSDWGIHLSRHLQILAASFPECFPLDHIAKLKCDHFMVDSLNGLKQWWPT